VVADSRAASGARRSVVGPSPPNLSRSAGEGAKRITTTPPDNSQRFPSPVRLRRRRGVRGEGTLRPFNQPRPVNVEADASGPPTSVERRAVEAVLETWRIDDEWWRPRPVSRVYWRLLLEDGRTVDIYYDRARERWYRQAYSR
jgi:hypothetical protein